MYVIYNVLIRGMKRSSKTVHATSKRFRPQVSASGHKSAVHATSKRFMPQTAFLERFIAWHKEATGDYLISLLTLAMEWQ